MPDYDFRALSPIDFEILVRDLLQAEFRLRLESFKPGKDLGIDFRYTTNKRKTVVVQCKHFAGAGLNALVSTLKNKELPKLRRLSPSRYILATSVPLSPANKSSLQALLRPFVKASKDILGRDDLNNLLSKFPLIERRTFKLWLSSLPLLEHLVDAGIHNISASELARIKRHAFLYVQNESFQEAVEILDTHNFCVIAGIPGIGKTLLAEMLTLHYLRAGYDIIKVTSDIAEAWRLVQPETRRIFYYDDFLGQTSFAEKLNKNEDQRLLDFIHSVRDSTGVKLIMTTREYILQQAYQSYEKLARDAFAAEKCVIDLRKYTRVNRAKILFNHIYFSDLAKPLRARLLENSAYLRIIDHPNYSPRIVQLLTDLARLRNVAPEDYVAYFMDSMSHPLLIWEHAFVHHLSQTARNLLITLVSMPRDSFLTDVERACQAYNLEYACHCGTTLAPHDFRSALRELDGDFLAYERVDDHVVVRFQNPSVRDYLECYLTSSAAELTILVRSASFIEQIDSLWHWRIARGGRDSVSTSFAADPAWAIEKARHVLTNGSCGLAHVRRDGVTRLEHWPMPLEAQIALIADIAKTCCGPLMSHVRENVPRVLEAVEGAQTDRDSVVNIIAAVRTLQTPNSEWATDFIRDATSRLLCGADSMLSSQLEPVCRLYTLCSDCLSQDTLRQIEDAVRESARAVADDEWSLNADELREEAEALTSMARRVDIDLRSEVEDIRHLAGRLEEKSGRDDNDIAYAPTPSLKVAEQSDDEIVSMFSTLLD